MKLTNASFEIVRNRTGVIDVRGQHKMIAIGLEDLIQSHNTDVTSQVIKDTLHIYNI